MSVHATLAHNDAPHLSDSVTPGAAKERMSISNNSILRFVGLDVHKRSVTVGAVDPEQHIVLRPLRLGWDVFDQWRSSHLHPTDAVVLESTANAWHIYDRINASVASVTVANPLLIQWISSAQIKTDAHDAIKLARLLAAGLVPAVWVPPEPVRQLRGLVSHRQRLIRQRTQARNRLQSVLQRHNLPPPEGELFGTAQRDWWNSLSLESLEQLLVTQDLQILDHLEPLIEQVGQRLYLESFREPWKAHTPFLLQQTGIGVLTAMILLAAIGDIQRFPRAQQLVGYAGLGARVHDSADQHRGGGITKQGRRDLRGAMVEAAWVAVIHNVHWKTRFEHLCKHLSKEQAITAIARQMLVVVWHVWHDHEPDQHTDPETVARKMMTWARDGGKIMREGLPSTQFVWQQLDRLGIGQEVSVLKYSNQTIQLPTPSKLS